MCTFSSRFVCACARLGKLIAHAASTIPSKFVNLIVPFSSHSWAVKRHRSHFEPTDGVQRRQERQGDMERGRQGDSYCPWLRSVAKASGSFCMKLYDYSKRSVAGASAQIGRTAASLAT